MLRGATDAVVADAIESGNPFPGTVGFAGQLEDGRLVRDVLGREPLFIDRTAPERWGFDPADLADPRSFPAGSVREDGSIREIWTLPESHPGNPETAESALEAALDTAIGSVDVDGVAIGFSGGIDSVYLAARLDAPLYTVGFPDSHDLEAAESAAVALGRDIRPVHLDHDSLERLIPRVADAIGRTNAMDVQIALPLVALAEAAEEDGFERLVLGQGADELFGGYAKVEKAPDDPRVDAESIRGARDEILHALPDQIERDTLAVRSAGLEPVSPYLHDVVVEASLSLPTGSLVHDGRRKVALRRAARGQVPPELIDTPKKAMQYGTLVSREMDRLARQAGFKRRMNDHVTRYVESRIT